MPERIQRKRTKGYRTPDGAIYVGRPTKWGNPFRGGLQGDAAEFVRQYRLWIVDGVVPWQFMVTAEGQWLLECQRSWILSHLNELRGHDLACWCDASHSCHADVLLELANQEATE